MAYEESITVLLETTRQNRQEYQLESFVEEFLLIWVEIHLRALDATLDDIFQISKDILHEYVLPFYGRFAEDPDLQKVDPWMQSFASIILRWKDHGSYLFPLILVSYEICYHDRGLLHYYLQKLSTKEIVGTKGALFEFLIPILTNFIVPLDEIDTAILRTSILLERDPKKPFRDIAKEEYTQHIDKSERTIFRRMSRIKLLNVIQTCHFLDMGQLGYETTLLFHTNDFPERYRDYLLLAASMPIGTFSLVQIPYNKSKTMHVLQESLESVLIYSMNRRVANWNLSGLKVGQDPWQQPPSLLYGTPQVGLISPTPRMDVSLKPSFNPFQLTPADIKILDFISTQGSFSNLNQLSKAIKVSVPRISQGLQNYKEKGLMLRMNQFFKIGLDLTLLFFLSIEGDEIPWIDHFLTFPKMDIFVNQDNSIHNYFGLLKLPNKWIKPFARNFDKITRDLRDFNMKFYYKIFTPIDHFKWGVQLKKTL